VNHAIVLKQNAYILFYKKRKDKSTTQQKNSVDNTTTNPVNGMKKGKRKRKEEMNTHLQSLSPFNSNNNNTSSASQICNISRPKLSTPSARAYYRTKPNSEELSDIVFRVELPLLVHALFTIFTYLILYSIKTEFFS
jgi:hypothetical protein